MMDPRPWAGANISILFPFAGHVSIDDEGYFKVFFTPEQFQALKRETARKNVYIPSFDKKGYSTALYTYPAAKLSLDKKQAGIVVIGRPRP